MILVVAGGYKNDVAAIEHCLTTIHHDYHIDLLIDGGEKYGVDEVARQFARDRGIPNTSFFSLTRTGRKSWLLRNLRMMAEKPNMVVSFDRYDKSAQHIVWMARERQIPVRYYECS